MQRSLSRLALFCLSLGFWPLLCRPAAGAEELILLPYLSTGYRYRVVRVGADAGFERREFDDTGFATGNAAFGTASSGCPLDSTVRTPWPSHTDLLLRKWFTLPADVRAVKVAVAIDNDLQVFINGIELTGGLARSEECAVRDRFVFPVPDALLIPGGANLLAVRARDRGLATYCDVEIRSGLPQALDPRAIVYTLRSGNNEIGGPDPLVWVQGSPVPLFGVIDSGLPPSTPICRRKAADVGPCRRGILGQPHAPRRRIPGGLRVFHALRASARVPKRPPGRGLAG